MKSPKQQENEFLKKIKRDTKIKSRWKRSTVETQIQAANVQFEDPAVNKNHLIKSNMNDRPFSPYISTDK